MLHTLYGRIALARRRWYERPGRRRRLSRPVISVGNLNVGGTGKTPLVAAIAAWLVEIGERPAILSRGYARYVSSTSPTVVADGARVLTDVAHAGDEPLMLARAVPGAVVVVDADRYRAGRLAEATLGATVHLLDDGFQHLALARDFDIVVTPAGALAADAVLPRGRLREPRQVLSRASLLVVVGATDAEAEAEARHYDVPRGIGATRVIGAPVAMTTVAPTRAHGLVALAGIGQPAQFFAALVADGWRVVDTIAFPDHHRYRPADLAAAARRVAAAGAWGIATTDKDAVRLEPLGPLPVAAARWPLTLHVPRFDVITGAIQPLLRGRS